MIKGIIFDVDGTLLDSMYIWQHLGERYLKMVGKEPEANLAKILFPMSIDESSIYLKDKYNLPDTVDKITDDTIKIIESFYLNEAKLKPGVLVFLEEMRKKNISMIIATSSDKNILKSAFKRLGILSFFKDVITCSELDTHKREAYIYLYCAKQLGEKPKDIAVFEDVLHGLFSAKEAGFITFAIEDETSASDKEEIKKTADYYVKDFTEIDMSIF